MANVLVFAFDEDTDVFERAAVRLTGDDSIFLRQLV